MHIAAVHLFPFNNHIITILLFIFVSGYLASINHTRIPLTIPGFYSVKDHDIHHNDVSSNFGQYIMYWDSLFATRKNSKPKSKIL
jgi:sterol desaturase/sphingolipid hydroxylase (fatty acid hydroxylase superfamily)